MLENMQEKMSMLLTDGHELVVKDVLTYVPRWPLLVHIFSAAFCLGCSSVYHLFMIHSEPIHELLSRLDYGGISILVMGR